MFGVRRETQRNHGNAIMRVLTQLGGFHFVAPNGVEVVRIEGGRGDGIPLMPNMRAVVSRLLDTLSCREPVDVVLVESMGGAYFRGPLRRRLKRDYERILIEALLRLVRRNDARLVVVDIADDLTVHPVNLPLLEHCDVYFKRELALDRWRSLESLHGGSSRVPTIGYRMVEGHQRLVEKLAPISLGFGPAEENALRFAADNELPSMDEKTYDLFYAGEDWCRPLRGNIREELRQSTHEGVKVMAPEGRLEYKAFAEGLRKSWLCVSPPGLGWDCYRHYEAGLFGAVPVLSQPDIWAYERFEHGVDAIYYHPDRAIMPQLRPWLEDKARLHAMAQRAKERVMKFHTAEARSQYAITYRREYACV